MCPPEGRTFSTASQRTNTMVGFCESGVSGRTRRKKKHKREYIMELFYYEKNGSGLSEAEQLEAVRESLKGKSIKRALLIPPDYTRLFSGAGYLACCYYNELKGSCQVDVLPALGTHSPMTKEECSKLYPDIPFDRFIVHDWRRDVVKIGEVSGEYIAEISGGLWTEPIAVEVNRLLLESYDLIISIGQVLPHEVIGMANHSKNIFVGVGGSEMINKSHMLGAICGMEQAMGRDHTPVRKVFDYALEHYLKDRPLMFVLTAATAPESKVRVHGLFIGDTRRVLEEAVRLSQQHNIDWLDRPVKKCVAYLEPEEFKSTWLGNKAVYRTRLAIADGGELLVLAPGVRTFGEDRINDALICKYGYRGRLRTLELLKLNEDLQANMGAAAHLIHGSSDGRFKITYAVWPEFMAEIESVGYEAADYEEAVRRYNPTRLKYGWNMVDGEKVFYVPNPALGLWSVS